MPGGLCKCCNFNAFLNGLISTLQFEFFFLEALIARLQGKLACKSNFFWLGNCLVTLGVQWEGEAHPPSRHAVQASIQELSSSLNFCGKLNSTIGGEKVWEACLVSLVLEITAGHGENTMMKN